MNNNNKNQIGRDIVCRSHSARSERDLYRICPSKLNKQELEDLYFALMENNLELKRTINGQKETIKTLSTKVQRMSAAQKGSIGRGSRECCLTTKAVVNDQKETISELKKSNERMSERIRLLNMRLCSAKQFLKRSPTQSTTRCVKCSTQPASSLKNSSTIALNTDISEINLKTTAVCRNDLIEKHMPSARSVHIETNEECEKEDSEKQCNENKCRTLMEELKQKIVNLQVELSNTHSEYSSRIGRLETEVTSLQARDRDTQDIASRLTRAEVRNGELAMELCIERGKVAELQTSVKAARMSSKVAATIEGHLANINQATRESYSLGLPLCSPCCPAEWEERSPRLQMQQSTPTKGMSTVEFRLDNYDIKHTKHSDDSGYTEANKSTEVPADDKGLNKVNQELMLKIVDLQTQLDRLQVSAIGEMEVNGKMSETLLTSEERATDKFDERMSTYVDKQDRVIIEPDKDIIIEPTLNTRDIKKNDLNTEQSTTNAPVAISEQSSTTIPTPKYPLVWVNEGQKNQEDTDEGSYTIKPGDKPPTPEVKPEATPSKDDHNRFQIPGPIASETNKFKHTRRRSSLSKIKSKDNQKSKDDVTIVKEGAEVKCSATKNHEDSKTANINQSKGMHDIIDSAAVKFIDAKCKGSMEISRQRFDKIMSKTVGDNMPAIGEKKIEDEQEHLLINYYVDPTKTNRRLSVEQLQPVPERRDTNVGTQVEYQAAVEPCPPYKCSTMDVHATYTLDDKTHESRESRDSRASDKDTDHEISAMTDLPTERDDKSPAETLSPGEEKARSSDSRSYSTPTTDYGTLSEGELPTVGRGRKLSVGERPMTDVTPSGCRRSSQQNMEEALRAVTEELSRCKQLLHKQQRSRVKSVDANVMVDLTPTCPAPIALKRAPGNQRIGDTFSPKCIFTLHIGTVVLSDEAVMNSRDMSLVLTWKFYDQNLAMTRMRAGRVVLFDFSTQYDVKITDDFLNYMKQEEMPIIICELDRQDEPFASCSLPLRDALLHTNRRADMSLALVSGRALRSARASTDALDALDAGDELGVLDLWCMLRAEPSVLPHINRAIARPTRRTTKSNSVHNMPMRSASRIMEQILEDDQSNDRLSQELDLGPRQRQSRDSVSPSLLENKSGRDVSVSHVNSKEKESPFVVPAYDYFDVNKYPVVRRRSSQYQRGSELSDSLNTDFGPKNPEEFAPKILTSASTEGSSNWQPPNIPSGVIINEVPANIRSTEEMKQALERNVQINNLQSSSRLTRVEVDSQVQTSIGSLKSMLAQRQKLMGSSMTTIQKPEKEEPEADALKAKRRRSSRFSFFNKKKKPSFDHDHAPRPREFIADDSDQDIARKYDNISKIIASSNRTLDNNSKKSVTIHHKYCETPSQGPQKVIIMTCAHYQHGKDVTAEESHHNQSIDITILWLALNEECEAMIDPKVQRLYVAYSFLGRSGADLETPTSLPKPKHYVDKCYFNFKKTFQLHDYDLPLLGHMAQCRSTERTSWNSKDCIIFSVISEPPEDPLGLDSCEDIGHAYLYLGDILTYSATGEEYTEVVPVMNESSVCGVLAVRLDGLGVLRRCLALSHSQRDMSLLRWYVPDGVLAGILAVRLIYIHTHSRL